MIRNILATFIFSIISTILSAQYDYFDVHYTGYQSLTSIDCDDSWLFTKSSGNWSPDYVLTFKVPSFYNRSILHNVLQFWNSEITTSSSKIHISNIRAETDYYGNFFFIFDITFDAGYTQPSFQVYINYRLSTEINLDVFNPSDQLPLNNVSPFIKLTYLAETDIIDWSNIDIKNKAIQISSGSSTELEVVQKIAEWTKSNVPYIPGLSSKASEVLKNGGDCDGQANLVIAFLRSLSIPARIASGYSFNIERSYPLWPPNAPAKFDQGKSGSGSALGHACYEVYYPSQNPSWVPGDPAQTTLHFTHISTLFIGSGVDINWFSNILSLEVNPTDPAHPAPNGPNGITTQQQLPYVDASVTNLITNFNYQYNNPFSGPLHKKSNILLNTSDRDIIVGINDKVDIHDPKPGTIMAPGVPVPNNTYLVTPNSAASFYALFVSGCNPVITSSSYFEWSIDLIHNGGIYNYLQGISCDNTYTPNTFGDGTVWNPVPGDVPNYEWIYDPSGNIYGELEVKAFVSDGSVVTR